MNSDAQSIFQKRLPAILEEYRKAVREELDARWKLVHVDLSYTEMYEVMFGLLARQSSLTCSLMLTPSLWNDDVAPLILRTIVETYIWLAWISKDALDRSRKYIEYGLGQQKLYLEHLKASVNDQEREGKDFKTFLQIEEAWLNSQKYEFLVPVNLGNIEGKGVRQIAIEADCKGSYDLEYSWLSGAVHSQWHHVGKFNLAICTNPLHKYHRIPTMSDCEPDLYFPMEAVEYMENSFLIIDDHFKISLDQPKSIDKLVNDLAELGKELSDGQ
jgi:hypothetical protein